METLFVGADEKPRVYSYVANDIKVEAIPHLSLTNVIFIKVQHFNRRENMFASVYLLYNIKKLTLTLELVNLVNLSEDTKKYLIMFVSKCTSYDMGNHDMDRQINRN